MSSRGEASISERFFAVGGTALELMLPGKRTVFPYGLSVQVALGFGAHGLLSIAAALNR